MEATQTKNATTTSVLYPIVSALVSAEEELGTQRFWKAIDEVQYQFLELAFGPGRSEVSGIPELESLASRDIEAINKFLRDRGFTIELRPTGAPGEFGVASVLKLALEWLEKGGETTVNSAAKNQPYPAVMLEKGVQFFEAKEHWSLVVRLLTKSGDEVFLTMTDERVPEEDLQATASWIIGNLESVSSEHKGVIFPMIDLDTQTDLSWLVGLSTYDTDGRPAVISQALQQTKFCMDEVGAKVESAVAMMIARGITMDAPKPYVINRPFLAIVRRPALSLPIFVGYLDTDCWKKPVR